MEIDDIDVRLIKLFYELKPKETTNTYILTQKIYPNKKSYDIVRKYPLIKKYV